MRLFVTMLVILITPMMKGENIMLEKPTKQESTVNVDYLSKHANDGDMSTRSQTSNYRKPYWQGDLIRYHTFVKVSIQTDSAWTSLIKKAFVGVSVRDIDCPGSDVIICGQWPENVNASWLKFSCNNHEPVRFVRIWKDDVGPLGMAEVAVEGILQRGPTEMNYESVMSKRFTAAYKSLKVAIASECASACYNSKLCVGFSFGQTQYNNCLLTNNTNLKITNAYWVSYTLKDCFVPNFCG